jgi:hypothetical protein
MSEIFVVSLRVSGLPYFFTAADRLTVPTRARIAAAAMNRRMKEFLSARDE